MKKRAKGQVWDTIKDRNVDNLLINKTDRKSINIIFLPVLFYPHIKKFKFRHFSRSSNVGSEQ